MLVGAFQGDDGGFTLSNVEELFDEPYRTAFKNSIEVSLVTALLGGLLGFLIAYSAIREGTPRVVRTVLTTFSGVAANFAGIPLAFAFIATLGTIGIVTQLARQPRLQPVRPRLHAVPQDRRRARLPLLPDPADDPRDRARDRRAQARVARGGREPRRDAVPVLALRRPAGADAVAPRRNGAALRQLVLGLRDGVRADGGSVNLVPITIGFVHAAATCSTNPHLGEALAFGMFVVLGLMMLIYIPLQRISSRWVR